MQFYVHFTSIKIFPIETTWRMNSLIHRQTQTPFNKSHILLLVILLYLNPHSLLGITLSDALIFILRRIKLIKKSEEKGYEGGGGKGVVRDYYTSEELPKEAVNGRIINISIFPTGRFHFSEY